MNAGVPTLDMINTEKELVVICHVQEMQTRNVVDAGETLFILLVRLKHYVPILLF